MQYTIVLLQSDPNVAQTLAASLSNSFHRVHVARSMDELRYAAAKHQPLAIVLDLESASLNDVESLKKEFQGIRVICNHRVADEEMWTRNVKRRCRRLLPVFRHARNPGCRNASTRGGSHRCGLSPKTAISRTLSRTSVLFLCENSRDVHHG